MRIRPARPDDLTDFLRISLATGDAGADAAALYADPDLVGMIYSAPYLRLVPELCLAAEDEAGPCGFAVGARDTVAFEARLERDWWPDLRRRYPAPAAPAPETPDLRRIRQIHAPRGTPAALAAAYPAHLHLNLLPRAQRRGHGSALLAAWLGLADVPAVHVGVNAGNRRALGFWRARGFRTLNRRFGLPSDRTVWLGRQAAPGA
jgi:ribosomal protein S18 acetylase RimI-like enzyme